MDPRIRPTLHEDQAALLMTGLIDVVERLDTLILEVRHLQINIIHSLGEPLLYQILRHEEKHLWGEKWEETFKKNTGEFQGKFDFNGLISEWMKEYPPVPKKEPSETKETVKEDSVESDGKEEVWLIVLKKQMHYNWTRGMWSVDQKRHYHNLLVAQELKRHIFHDKLRVSEYAYHLYRMAANWWGKDPRHSPLLQIHPLKRTLSNFYLLRAAVMKRIDGYVSRIGDHIAQFSKIQDQSHMRDHPGQSLERRREQRLYNSFLADRCRDLRRLMAEMLEKLELKKNKVGSQPIMHRWGHESTSRVQIFENEMHSRLDGKTEGEDTLVERLVTHYVNTSFWMPERPDLQSIIAHEIAHTLIHEYLDDLSRLETLANPNAVGWMIRHLQHCIEVYHPPVESPDHTGLLREILADLMAASVKGPAYLFALFLELIGRELEELFAAPIDRFDLDRIDTLEGSAGRVDQFREWYLRLFLVCHWNLGLLDKEAGGDDPFQKRMTNAILVLLDNILNTLDRMAPSEQLSADYWRNFAWRMKQILDDPAVLEPIRLWRRMIWDEAKENETGHSMRFRGHPPTSYPLSNPLRNFLLERLYLHKNRNWLFDPPHKKEDPDEVEALWEKVYGISGVRSYKDLQKKGLFHHLSDLSWQSFWMHGLEFSEEYKLSQKQNSKKPSDFFIVMHHNSDLGREFYHVALDMFLVQTAHSFHRAIESVRMIEILLQQLEGELAKGQEQTGTDEWKDSEDVMRAKRRVVAALDRWLNGWSFPAPELEGGLSKEAKKSLATLLRNKELGECNIEVDMDKYFSACVRMLGDYWEKGDLNWRPDEYHLENCLKKYNCKENYTKKRVECKTCRVAYEERLREILLPYVSARELVSKYLSTGVDTEIPPHERAIHALLLEMKCREMGEELNKLWCVKSDDTESIPIREILNKEVQNCIVGNVKDGCDSDQLNSDHLQRSRLVASLRNLLALETAITFLMIGENQIISATTPPNGTRQDSAGEKQLDFNQTLFLSFTGHANQDQCVRNKPDQENEKPDHSTQLRPEDDLNPFYMLARFIISGIDRNKLHPDRNRLSNGTKPDSLRLASSEVGEAHHPVWIFKGKTLEVLKSRWRHGCAAKQAYPKPPCKDPDKAGLPFTIMSFTTLGRYDQLRLVPTRPMCHCALPRFVPASEETEENSSVIEPFPVFYIRRELAMPVFLHNRRFPPWEDPANCQQQQQPMALLTIVLGRPSSRMEFLFRLLRSIEREKKKDEKNKVNLARDLGCPPQFLEQIGQLFSENDMAYLTEGFGDLIVVFYGDDNRRLEAIFRAQCVMFEDFQVDRTELILSRKCMNIALLNKGYQVDTMVRLSNDNTLMQYNREFIGQVQRLLKDENFPLKGSINRFPGRMDFVINLKPRKGIEEKDFTPHFQKLFENGPVDRIQTNITRKPESYKHLKPMQGYLET